MQPAPLTATASFWLVVLGVALALAGRRQAGGALLALVGFGGIGISWERTCGADIRRLCLPPRHVVTNVLTHAPAALVGTWLIARGR